MGGPKELTLHQKQKMDESIADQLNNFDDLLFDSLDFQMRIHTNRGFWEETDNMDTDSQNGIENCIDYGFDQMFERYKYSRLVLDILEPWCERLHDILWIAMDVPYPRNLDMHIDRILDNCRNIFYNQIWAKLEAAMIQEVSRVQIIQRNWRKAISCPDYDICKKRLRNEFRELNS
jgi:hypothetical protein